MLLFGLLERSWGFTSQPHLIGLGIPLPFLFGPLLYLYVVALTRPAAKLEARWLVHGLPFALDVLFMSQIFFLKSGAEKLALVEAYRGGQIPPSLRLVEGLRVGQAV